MAEMEPQDAGENAADMPEPTDDNASQRGVVVAVYGGTIVLRARPDGFRGAPTIAAVEKVVAEAIELSGYQASVDLTRTDR